MSGLKLLFLVAAMPCIFGIPVGPSTDNDMVIVTETTTLDEEIFADSAKENVNGPFPVPIISEMNINSNISNRFATTVVRSKVKNSANKAQETTFFVIIPENAFISSFIMEIGGQNYTAYVKEKKEAQATYDTAVAGGFSAAHVAVSARDSNKFTVSVNVEPESKAIFYLTYEELLERKNGYYELKINIHPKQLVKNLDVNVDIEELRPITMVEAPPIRSGNEITKESDKLESRATIKKPEPTKASIKFNPDYEQQKQIAQGLGTKEDEGMAGQFIVQYDVERDPSGGEVLIKDGYFVHFFSPSELPTLNKHVIFVLDTSGSMYDRKLIQLKDAMHTILGELNPKDSFNLVEFNTNVKVWNLDAPSESTIFPHGHDAWYSDDRVFDLTDVSFPPAYPVTNNTVKKAKAAITDMISTGGTNIYEALRVGIHLVKLRQKRTGDKTSQPIIVFLTDGDPTVGKTSTQAIISGIAEQNIINVPIMSLSFGSGADKNFLEQISLKNHGFARHIYEDSDAQLQLENFYKLISSPLLHDVKFSYTPDATSLTKTDFPILFDGSEIVIAGEIPTTKDFGDIPKVSAWGIKGPTTFKPTIRKTSIGQLERLWAYLTVNKYLDAKKVAENGTIYEKKALDLALKYSFVTPVSSLVVVKPNATTAPVDAVAADGKNENFGYAQFSGQMPNRMLISAQAKPKPSLAIRRGSTLPAPYPAPYPYPASPMLGAAGQPSYSLASSFGGAPALASLGAPSASNFGVGAPGPVAGFGGGGGFAGAAGPPPGLDISNTYASTTVGYPFAVMPKYAMMSIVSTTPQNSTATTNLQAMPDDYDADGSPNSEIEIATEISTTSTTITPVTVPPTLAAKLPWLVEQSNVDGTLKFLKARYTLGTNETSPVDQDCTTPKSEEGNCKLLKDCEVIYSDLTGPQTFQDYFCSIEKKFAGVCCPKKQDP